MSEFSVNDSLFHLGPPRTNMRRTQWGGVDGGNRHFISTFRKVHFILKILLEPQWNTSVDHLNRITNRLRGTQTGQRQVMITFGHASISANVKAS